MISMRIDSQDFPVSLFSFIKQIILHINNKKYSGTFTLSLQIYSRVVD